MKIIGRNAVAEVIKTDKTIDKILVENGYEPQKFSHCNRSGFLLHKSLFSLCPGVF